MRESMLEAADITVVVAPDTITLQLPAESPPSRWRLLVIVALCLAPISALLSLLGSLPLGIEPILLTVLAALIVQRIHARARYQPRDIVLTPHTILAEDGPVDLSSIQSIWIEESEHDAVMFAHTTTAAVLLARHRSTWVLEAARPTVLEHVGRCREALRAAGTDPDAPERIPRALQRLRQPT